MLMLLSLMLVLSIDMLMSILIVDFDVVDVIGS